MSLASLVAVINYFLDPLAWKRDDTSLHAQNSHSLHTNRKPSDF